MRGGPGVTGKVSILEPVSEPLRHTTWDLTIALL